MLSVPGFPKPCTREVAQSCPSLCDPMDCSLRGSSIHGIFQARILECVAISFSRGFSWPGDWTQVSSIASRGFYHLNHRVQSKMKTQNFSFKNHNEFQDGEHHRHLDWTVLGPSTCGVLCDYISCIYTKPALTAHYFKQFLPEMLLCYLLKCAGQVNFLIWGLKGSLSH